MLVFLTSAGPVHGQNTVTNSAASPSAIGAGTSGSGLGVPYRPYPSTINVAGLADTISKVTVALNNVSLDRPDDVVVLLQGPTGANLVIVSDVGGTSAASNVTMAFLPGWHLSGILT